MNNSFFHVRNMRFPIRFVLTSVLIFTAMTLRAQQSPDLEVWRNRYRDRIRVLVEDCKSRQGSFAEDVRFTGPDYIAFIPKIEPDRIGDTYNDHFLVFDKQGGPLFAVWTQASIEGAPDQHIVFSKSMDKGTTWSEPLLLAGSPTFLSGKPIASWGFPLLSKSGRIYILYNQYVPGKVSWNRQHTGVMEGIFSDDDGETWSAAERIEIPRTTNDHEDPLIPAEWVVWQKPLRLAADGRYLVGMSRYLNPEKHDKYKTVTEFLRFDNVDDDPEVRNLRISWFMNGERVLSSGSHCEEPAIVKLPDGRLFSILRTAQGHPSWTLSTDGGENWTSPQALLDKRGDPFAHPLSPCPLYDWKGPTAGSGFYFTFIHNTKIDPGKPYANRGPLYLLPGRFDAGSEQPIAFGEPRLFVNRSEKQSFYTSTTMIDGKLVLWYPDQKFYLLGRTIDEKWFE